MRIAVVGSVVDDTILHADGRCSRSLGGIGYAVGALRALAWPGVRIVPICRVGADVRCRLEHEWEPGAGVVAAAGLVFQKEPGARVELDYRSRISTGDRSERLTRLVAPLGGDELAEARGADLVLVNCITGFDVELEALEALARDAPLLYLDVHSLALALLEDGRRVPRRPRHIRRWMASAAVVQCNVREAETLAGGADIGQTLTAMLGPTGRAALVTDGARGATLLRPGKSPSRVAAGPAQLVDPTGAGDTFGAAFCLALMRGADLLAATEIATHVASAACGVEGTAGLARLPELLGGTMAELL